jgi:hypothetical protein
MTHYESIFGRYMSQRRHRNTVPSLAVVQTMEILAAYDRFFSILLAKLGVFLRNVAVGIVRHHDRRDNAHNRA